MLIGDNQQEGPTLWLFSWFRRFRGEAAEQTCSTPSNRSRAQALSG